MSIVRIVGVSESEVLQKRAKASWISASSSAVMSFSLASLERLFAGVFAVDEAAAGALRLGG